MTVKFRLFQDLLLNCYDNEYRESDLSNKKVLELHVIIIIIQQIHGRKWTVRRREKADQNNVWKVSSHIVSRTSNNTMTLITSNKKAGWDASIMLTRFTFDLTNGASIPSYLMCFTF